MLIASPLHETPKDYSTGPPTPFDPEQDAFLLLPDAARSSEVSTPGSYRTADDGVETLDTTKKIQQVFTSSISSMSDRQLREAFAMLIQHDTGIS